VLSFQHSKRWAQLLIDIRKLNVLTNGEDDWQKTIEKIISWEKLARIGRNTVGEADKETKATNKKLGVRAGTIEGLIRPKAPLPHSQRKNLFALIKDDIQNVGHDQNRQIARAIKAIIGAVYFDGGFEAARRVMAVLRLTIQGTEKKS
jgi:dsRNA-specific ribonuclease